MGGMHLYFIDGEAEVEEVRAAAWQDHDQIHVKIHVNCSATTSS